MNRNIIDDIRMIVEDEKSITEEDFNSDKEIIDLRFIVEECPPTRIVREWMQENIKSVNEDDPFFIMLQEQIN